jgi:1,4-alpha-glucan branching enzyme
VPRDRYRVGVPAEGTWTALANSDAAEFGGSGYAAADAADTQPVPHHGRPQSLELTLPPLACVLWRRQPA